MMPWAQMIRVAAHRLGWLPSDFWRATPKEFNAALGWPGTLTADAPGRMDLEQLMRTHPDRG